MGDNSMFAAACATEGKTAGWLPESSGFLRIHKVNNYYAMAEYQVVWPNAELWRGYYNAGDDGLKWSGWQPIATATPPQEYGLPLASGFSNGGGGNSVYWKDQFNQVHFLVSVTNQNSLSSGDVIATLPAGFRPSKIAIFVLGSLVSAVRKTGSLNVKSDGSIVYFGDPLSSGAVSFGAGAFVAVG